MSVVVQKRESTQSGRPTRPQLDVDYTAVAQHSLIIKHKIARQSST